MLTYIKGGNILQENTEAIVNPVNCVGIMGKGLALEFKKRYPKNFIAYKEAAKDRQIRLGRVFVCDNWVFDGEEGKNPRYIINFPTKYHWSDKSSLNHISDGIWDLMHVVHQYRINSISIPALGCGLGGLDWQDVKDIFDNQLDVLDADVRIFEPI